MPEPTTPPEPPKPETPPAEPEAEPDAPLGESGEKALGEERKARRAAEKTLREATAELEKLRAEHATEQEKAIAAAKAEGKTEALKTANERLIKAEVKAAAAGKFANPALATKVLDLDEFEVDDDGEVDAKSIEAAIDAFLKDNPELAGKGRPAGDAGGGPRGGDAPATGDDWLRKMAGIQAR